MTYLQVSPNGDSVSFTRLADEQTAGIEENLPELHVVNIVNDQTKKIADSLGVIHRWSPDSKSIYVVKLETKNDQTNLYTGKLRRIDATTGKGDDLAQLVGPNQLQMDVAPDGQMILFTASASTQLGKALPTFTQENVPGVGLFVFDVKAGTVRKLREEAMFAFYSPQQTKVLIGSEGENNAVNLEVTDLNAQRSVAIATDAAAKAGGMGMDVSIYPTWLDDHTVIYIGRRAVFGSAAENFVLTTIGADGKNRKIHQPAIDTALMK
jgi:Tol biopolymer transport system component